MTEKEAFLLMEEQGWQPMPCDTPIPLYDEPASCGLPSPVGNETNDVTMLPKDFVKSMDAFVIRAKGDSMIGANIIDGDFVLVDKTAQVYDSDIVVALIDGECVLKCYCTDDEGQTWLAPRNDAYDAIPVREGQDLFIKVAARHSPRMHRCRQPHQAQGAQAEGSLPERGGGDGQGDGWQHQDRPPVVCRVQAVGRPEVLRLECLRGVCGHGQKRGARPRAPAQRGRVAANGDRLFHEKRGRVERKQCSREKQAVCYV